MNYKHWTAADQERLRQLWSADMPAIDIAHQLGRSVTAVRTMASTLKLGRRETTPNKNQRQWNRKPNGR